MKNEKEPRNIKLPEDPVAKEKLNFWKRLWISIKDFERYQELAGEKVTTAVGYFFKIVLIFTIIATITGIYRFHTTFQSFLKVFDETIENMEIQDGKLKVEQDDVIRLENIEFLDGKVIIDTKTENQETIQSYVQEIKSTNDSVLFLQDRIVYKNGILSEPTQYSYETIMDNLGLEHLNKQEILDYFTFENLAVIYSTLFIILLIYLYILYLASTFVDVMILSLLGFVTTKLTGLRIRYSALFNMGIYAMTLSLLLNMVYLIIHSLTGFVIEYFQIMYTAISYIYMVTAILLIKSDLIKKQMELMRIQEEQQKIHEELARQEEEEKQREQEEELKRRAEKRKKNKERKEKEEQEKKEKNDGPTPQGNNA